MAKSKRNMLDEREAIPPEEPGDGKDSVEAPAVVPPPVVPIPKPDFAGGPWIAVAGGGVYGGKAVTGATDALRASKHALEGGARAVAILSGDPAVVPEELRERLIAVLAEIAGRR